VTIEKAMISAGYTGLSQSGLYYVAGKICKKYERAAGGAAQVFQDLGYGQVRVAMGIIDHAENSPPTVSLNALKLAAQCQGMVDKNEDRGQGINIIINTGPPQPLAGTTCPAPDGPVQIVIAGQEPGAAAPRKPLQITR